jgi:L-fuconolactonase
MAQATEPMRVDAHQHFWRYSEEEYGWINDAMAGIRRDFLPADLLHLLKDARIDATVAVQAHQSIEETEWLLELAGANPWIAGVVGWVPLVNSRVEELLEKVSTDTKLKGIRHVLQGEADEYMLREDFNAGIALLRKYALTYDVLILQHQLSTAIQFVDRHPEQAFVLDHLAKPLIAAHELDPWRKNIRELARRPHVMCKLSGLVTEADFHAWTADDLLPYIETALQAFGPGRLLFGSDWPVCTVAVSYARWVDTVQSFINNLSSSEQSMIMGGNCASIYRLTKSS